MVTRKSDPVDFIVGKLVDGDVEAYVFSEPAFEGDWNYESRRTHKAVWHGNMGTHLEYWILRDSKAFGRGFEKGKWIEGHYPADLFRTGEFVPVTPQMLADLRAELAAA